MLKDKLTDLWSKLKKIKIEYLIVIALSIVALFIVFNTFSNKAETNSSENEIEDYVSGLEEKLEKCLKSVSGAGNVKVIISVASGKEQVVATESKTDRDGSVIESPLMVNGKPFVIKESYPEIVGVVIVAEGAEKLSVKMNLLSAAQVFLSIDESKIKVLSA